MPSPVAHGLAGLALAHIAARLGFVRAGATWWIVALCVAANAPDFDFIPGILIGEPARFHHGPSHTLVGVALFMALCGAFTSLAGVAGWRRLTVVMGLAYLSHLLLDMVTLQDGKRAGMTILWPFSAQAFSSPFYVFLNIRHSQPHGGFLAGLWQWHNVRAVVWELVVTGGLLVLYRALSAGASAIWRWYDPAERRCGPLDLE